MSLNPTNCFTFDNNGNINGFSNAFTQLNDQERFEVMEQLLNGYRLNGLRSAAGNQTPPRPPTPMRPSTPPVQQTYQPQQSAMLGISALDSTRKRVLKILMDGLLDYDGRKDAVALDNYLNRLEMLFQYDPAIGDYDRMLIASSHLKKAAFIWWQANHMGLFTWDHFVRKLRAYFYPVDTIRSLRERLERLYQKKSVREYLANFDEVSLHIPDLSPAEREAKFIRGLKPQVRMEVEMKVAFYRRDGGIVDWSLLTEIASTVDDILYRSSNSTLIAPRTFNNNNNNGGRRNNFNNHGDHRDNNGWNNGNRRNGGRGGGAIGYHDRSDDGSTKPMDVDSVIVGEPGKPLTADQKEKLAKNRGCFYCRKTNAGHIAKNCPAKTKRTFTMNQQASGKVNASNVQQTVPSVAQNTNQQVVSGPQQQQGNGKGW